MDIREGFRVQVFPPSVLEQPPAARGVHVRVIPGGFGGVATCRVHQSCRREHGYVSCSMPTEGQTA